jgi:hypothetical protein
MIMVICTISTITIMSGNGVEGFAAGGGAASRSRIQARQRLMMNHYHKQFGGHLQNQGATPMSAPPAPCLNVTGPLDLQLPRDLVMNAPFSSGVVNCPK